MALLKALLLGLIGAVAVPFALRHETGLLRPWIDWRTLHPLANYPDIPLSLPILFAVTIFAMVFFVWSNR